MSARVDAVMEAWAATGPGIVTTSTGVVHLLSVQAREQDGQEWVEITVDSPAGGDAAFRVFNPPAYLPDPAGGYRWDPLAALAEVIGSNGGARR